MSAEVISFRANFRPLGKDAERTYDRVVQRMNQLSAIGKRHQQLVCALKRQFVGNAPAADLDRDEKALADPAERSSRLELLLRLSYELRVMDDERERLGCQLEAMNRAIEAWAHETYGGPVPAEACDDHPPQTKS